MTTRGPLPIPPVGAGGEHARGVKAAIPAFFWPDVVPLSPPTEVSLSPAMPATLPSGGVRAFDLEEFLAWSVDAD